MMLAGLAGGCDSRTPITRYSVPKTETTPTQQPPASQDVMVVGIGLHEGTAWFFKLVGEKSTMVEVEGEFERFLESVSFADATAGVPRWQAPEDWQRRPGSAFRFATYELPNDLELSISTLSYQNELEEYLRMNVDRWRREMGLPAVAPEASILAEVESLEKSEGQFFVLRLEGSFSGGAMRGGRGAASAARGAATSPAPARDIPDRPVTKVSAYELPEGWSRGGATQFSKVSLNFAGANGEARITVSDLPADINRWEDNVLRWAGQVQANLEPDEVAAATEDIEVDGVSSRWIALPRSVFAEAASEAGAEGNGQALVGVMSVHGDTAWFIRLSGEQATVLEQLDTFRTFLSTLELEP